MLTTDQISPTDTRVRGNLLREYEQKFETFFQKHFQLTKLCSNACHAKTVEKTAGFHDTGWHRTWQTERSMSRVHPASKWSIISSEIFGKTKIGPVLDIVCFRQGRYGVEIMIWSLFGEKTCSWFRIVNGIDKYVTEIWPKWSGDIEIDDQIATTWWLSKSRKGTEQ